MKQTICLNMIVKNESAVIERCLKSVKKLIDYWVIVDTGSHDGTQEIIRRYMKDVPGELYERPWIHFAHNRNEALSLAKNHGDYLLFIDADERLQFDDSFTLPELKEDFYTSIVEVEGGVRIHRTLLVNSRLDWWWVGVLHEAIDSRQAKSFQILPGVINIASQDGSRSKDPNKFLKDAEVLEKALLEDPRHRRDRFYLAFSYDIAGRYEDALHNYQKRIDLGGEPEVLFYSLYRIAWLQEQLHMSWETIVSSYFRAYSFRPTRAEPLFCLAHFFVKRNAPFLGYIISRFAQSIPYPNDAVLVDAPVYAYRLLEQYADCCCLLNKQDETRAAYLKLLAIPELPAEDRAKIRTFLSFPASP